MRLFIPSILVAAALLMVAGAAIGQTRPAASAPATGPAQTGDAASKIISPDDGWLDMSGFLDQAYGFLPIVIPITEPAVGYGAAGALAFLDRPRDRPEGKLGDGLGRPNITAVGGLATNNGTSGLAVGDVRHWLDDRIQTLAGAVYASVNLDFYGIGRDTTARHDARTYNLEPLGGVAGAKYRLGESRFWAGLSYAWAATDVEFDTPFDSSRLPDSDGESRVGGLTPSLTFDSRDNIFTPTRGSYMEVSTGLYSQALGGDGEFQRVGLIGMHFLPVTDTVTLGVRADAALSFGDVPFYLRPFIGLRGVQAMRYQGEHVADIEAELRWQFWKRFSVVGFAGAGAAWNDFARFENSLTAVSGGVGFRYELARRYGLHVGIDIAVGPDDPAIYIQFGSAWARP